MGSLMSFEGDGAQRASDADRDRVAAVIGEALATGRLTSVEHADRLEAAYSAVTLGELAPIVRDLPETTGTASQAPGTGRQEVSAIFSKVIRRGRWVTGRHTLLRSWFGALIVDLTDAVMPGREITLQADSFCGKLIIRVPKNARILDEGGSALFSKRDISGGADTNDPNTPLIRVTGRAMFGKIVVRR
ncbi:DUF1707 domain-containing protein [Sphaerisporangium sp. TRM90804]|uniref:DUF1707 SHOCT-like domain-containing protein n=1 Tax=Sphaerisporangium sp. TRM90804 TaxID=3031113 RepID=UPI002446EFFA|nr:DUF1707 domain-containing protein [Sphaerisporangium sp. TRM90804]MDH2430439.1 DUF1707 domain-containing protein [Sphaerisporangium sp. TRM90804]